MMRTTDIEELKGAVRYPLPPTVFNRWADDMDVYVRFMRAVRESHYTKVEQKIFSAIQITAAASAQGDADVALALVGMGLRAPRAAFPADFLAQVDQARLRCATWGQALAGTLSDLIMHWETGVQGTSEQAGLLMAGPLTASPFVLAT